jgi:hypothetical protein
MRSLLFSTVSILGGFLASQAFAQSTPTPRPIAIGQTINSTIGPEDAKLAADQSSYETYRVQVPAGRRVTATLTSTAFQPVLGIGARMDDDCNDCAINVGETTKPAVVSRMMTSAGALELRVNTMNEGETGAFTLAVVATTPPALSAQPITFGQSQTGALTASDAVSGDDNALTDAYALRLNAGQEVQIDLSSSQFDAKLELMSPTGERVADDDDNGPGNNARIRYTAPRAGVYQIRAMSYGDGSMGAYTVRAGARPVVMPMPAPRPLVLGTPMAGAITAQTPRYETDGEETTAVRYSFNATAGSIYRITATKKVGSELDPKVNVGKLVNGNFSISASDDDGGNDMNAAMRFKPETSGVYVVEVVQVGENLGAYDVTVTQSPPDRAPANAINVTLGTDYRGTLADGGARTTEDVLFNSYAVTLKAGDRVTVHMKKDGDTNLDPKVEIGRGTVTAFESLAEDDDGGAELNARLRYVAPADGSYIIRATTVSDSGEGTYIVRVETTPPLVAPPAPTPIQIGQQVRGSLSDTDPLLNDTTYYDRYLLTGNVGDTFEISVTSANIDVIVGARSALRNDDDYATDDDGGTGTNAKLTYTVTTAGPQTIRVTNVGDEVEGDYTISIVKK